MTRALKLYIPGVGAAAVAALALAFVVADGKVDPRIGIPVGPYPDALGLLFWTAMTAVAWALPVQLPRGTYVAVSTAPTIAAMALGGPLAAGFVALFGTF